MRVSFYNICKKIPFFVLLFAIFLTSTGFSRNQVFDISQEIKLIDRIYIEGEGYVDLVRGEVITSRIDGTFTAFNVNSFQFSYLVSRNNWFSAVIHIQPFLASQGLTDVDIMVTWPGNSVLFPRVPLNQVRAVHIPWNAGRYTIWVRSSGITGTIHARVWDQIAW